MYLAQRLQRTAIVNHCLLGVNGVILVITYTSVCFNANQLEELPESSTEAREVTFHHWRGLPACPKPPHFAPLLGLPQMIPPTTLKVSRPSCAKGNRSACISMSNCVACSAVSVSSECVLRACWAAM